MSIAVAVRKGNEIVLAADSQTNFGSLRVTPENHKADKIRKIGNAYLAGTGWSLYENIFDDFLRQKGLPPLTTKASMYRFFLRLWKDLHDRYSLVKDQPRGDDDESPFGDIDASFLIVNARGIYYVASDMSIVEFNQYFAIGSGSDYSLGALHALYGEKLKPEAVARRAVDAALAFNVHCGGAIEVRRLRMKSR